MARLWFLLWTVITAQGDKTESDVLMFAPSLSRTRVKVHLYSSQVSLANGMY